MNRSNWICSLAQPSVNLLLAVLTLSSGCGSAQSGSVETYAVKRGEFVSSVTESGELDAVKSTLIQAPPHFMAVWSA